MPNRTSKSGSELFIVDNSDVDWKVMRYLHEWCQISSAIDVATAYFEIGALLGLQDEWQKVDKIRILMGDEVSKRTKSAFVEGLAKIKNRLDSSLESEKTKNDFLAGVPAIVEAIRSGKILCRVYRKEKFHAKAYITHDRSAVRGSAALVGSSNLTYPGLTENIELNIQITGAQVSVLQEWYEEHWSAAEDVSAEVLSSGTLTNTLRSRFTRRRCMSYTASKKSATRNGFSTIRAFIRSLGSIKRMASIGSWKSPMLAVAPSFAMA